MPTVGLLHPGEMGASIGAALRRAGVQVLSVQPAVARDQAAHAGRGPDRRGNALRAGRPQPGGDERVPAAPAELYRRLTSLKEVEGDPPLDEVLRRVRGPSVE